MKNKTGYMLEDKSSYRKHWKGRAVIATSPLRVDLCGMTDYILAESWCVNSTIGGTGSVMRMEERSDDLVVIESPDSETLVFTLDDAGKSDHMLLRALTLHEYTKKFDFGMNVRICCGAETTGLSSSSSVSSLFNAALGLVCDEPYDPLTIAKQTQAIEPHYYGRQDQLAVSFGGFNLWHMTAGSMRGEVVESFGQIEQIPVNMPEHISRMLEEECFLVYDSGIREGASTILKAVMDEYKHQKVRRAFSNLNSLAKDIARILSEPNVETDWLYELGEVFDSIREAHESLHPLVTNQRSQDLFTAAKQAGALGGRYSGAGGRGAITFICLPGQADKIADALDKVSTPYVMATGKTYTHGGRINLGGFVNARASAQFLQV